MRIVWLNWVSDKFICTGFDPLDPTNYPVHWAAVLGGQNLQPQRTDAVMGGTTYPDETHPLEQMHWQAIRERSDWIARFMRCFGFQMEGFRVEEKDIFILHGGSLEFDIKCEGTGFNLIAHLCGYYIAAVENEIDLRVDIDKLYPLHRLLRDRLKVLVAEGIFLNRRYYQGELPV